MTIATIRLPLICWSAYAIRSLHSINRPGNAGAKGFAADPFPENRACRFPFMFFRAPHERGNTMQKIRSSGWKPQDLSPERRFCGCPDPTTL